MSVVITEEYNIYEDNDEEFIGTTKYLMLQTVA
jgi:hypothetical protein